MDFLDRLIPIDQHCCDCGAGDVGLWFLGNGKMLCENCRRGRDQKRAMLLPDSLVGMLLHADIIKAMQKVLRREDLSGRGLFDAVRKHDEAGGRFSVVLCVGPNFSKRQTLASFIDKGTAEEISNFIACHVYTEVFVADNSLKAFSLTQEH